jgi:hypothetical protein
MKKRSFHFTLLIFFVIMGIITISFPIYNNITGNVVGEVCNIENFRCIDGNLRGYFNDGSGCKPEDVECYAGCIEVDRSDVELGKKDYSIPSYAPSSLCLIKVIDDNNRHCGYDPKGNFYEFRIDKETNTFQPVLPNYIVTPTNYCDDFKVPSRPKSCPDECCKDTIIYQDKKCDSGECDYNTCIASKIETSESTSENKQPSENKSPDSKKIAIIAGVIMFIIIILFMFASKDLPRSSNNGLYPGENMSVSRNKKTINYDDESEDDDNYELTSCEVCGGSGEHRCEVCSGSGEHRCDSCSGSGGISCPNCNGLGCSNCYEKGEIRCGSCDGTGEIRCGPCDGKGSSECNVCDGAGKTKTKKLW